MTTPHWTDTVHCERCGLTPAQLWNHSLKGLVERAQTLTTLAGLLERLSSAEAAEMAIEAAKATWQARCLLDCDKRADGGWY